MRVLSRDQQAVADDVWCPVHLLRKDRAQFQHLIFDKERYDLGEADPFFLAIGETGNFLVLHQELAVGRLDMTQSARGMTYDSDCLAGSNEGLDQFDGVFVFGEIPHWPVAARIKDGVEVFLPNAVKANGLVEISLRVLVLFEPERQLGAVFRFIALGVKRRPATLRRCECYLDAGILENVVGSGELFEPETRLSSGVAQLVV